MSDSSQPTPSQPTRHPIVEAWLIGVYLMIFFMVIIGGTTRLTGSGLSMVEWHPLMGALPPGSESEWQKVFVQYQGSPQYQLVNSWMDLAAFKRIFFWEYFHRLTGRLIGVVVVVPWLFFVLRKKLSVRTSRGAAGAVLLGGMQGLLGWYMVKSGLSSVPEVSHFRLGAHLILALIVSQWILWMLLDLRAPWKGQSQRAWGGRWMPLLLMHLLYLQIAYGAFVAGKRAGLLSATFPDMNGHYLPGPFFVDASLLQNILNNPLLIHYLHRLGAFVTLGAFVWAGIALWRNSKLNYDRGLGKALVVMVSIQFFLGALTVLSSVSIPWAVAHQAGAFVLLGLLTALIHRSMERKVRT